MPFSSVVFRFSMKLYWK